MDYNKMYQQQLAKRAAKRKQTAPAAKPTWQQQLATAAMANGIRETAQAAVIRLYGQYQRTKNAGHKLVLETRIKTICNRHGWPYPGNIGG